MSAPFGQTISENKPPACQDNKEKNRPGKLFPWLPAYRFYFLKVKKLPLGWDFNSNGFFLKKTVFFLMQHLQRNLS